MIPVEGRAIAGLDEFMLRLGHLSAICRVATTDGGSAHRFERAITSKFTDLVSVPVPLAPAFARYLRIKGLSPVEAKITDAKEKTNKENEYRYPELRVVDPGGPHEAVVSDHNKIMGQWQDVSLSHPTVNSKVGAISFGGKKSSKSGLSHLLDWGGFLGLFNGAGALTNFGQLIGKYPDVIAAPNANPYALGTEKLIYGYIIAREDFDVFASLVSLLAAQKDVLRKQDGMQLYTKVVTDLSDRAEKSRNLSQGRRQEIFSLWREVKPRRRSEDQITSTAWHRISARLENFVDLGLLQKDVSEQYEYKYRTTENLQRARQTLETSVDATAWIDSNLVDVLIGGSASDDPIAASDLEPHLLKLLSVLSRPMSPLPLDVIASGLAALSLNAGAAITIGTARRSLENYAVEHPERARLSAGATRKAEYISIDAASLARERL